MFCGVPAPETGYTRGCYLDVKKHNKIFVETACITFVFVCHQDKRPEVGGANIYLGFYGVLAPETAYTRVYYLGAKKHKDIRDKTAFITISFICHQDKRPRVGAANIYLEFHLLSAFWFAGN